MSWRMYQTPDNRIGYYQGSPPRYGGVGSMAGPKAAGTIAGPGLGAPGSNSGWHPTVKVLLVAVVLEIAAFGVLRYYTNHGG